MLVLRSRPLPFLQYLRSALQIVWVACIIYLHFETCLVARLLTINAYGSGGAALIRRWAAARPFARTGLILPSNRFLPLQRFHILRFVVQLIHILNFHLFGILIELGLILASLVLDCIRIWCVLLECRVFLRDDWIDIIIIFNLVADVTVRGYGEVWIPHLVQWPLLWYWIDRNASAKVHLLVPITSRSNGRRQILLLVFVLRLLADAHLLLVFGRVLLFKLIYRFRRGNLLNIAYLSNVRWLVIYDFLLQNRRFVRLRALSGFGAGDVDPLLCLRNIRLLLLLLALMQKLQPSLHPLSSAVTLDRSDVIIFVLQQIVDCVIFREIGDAIMLM